MDDHSKKIKILVIASGRVDPDWTWLSKYFDKEKYEWEFCGLDTEKTTKMVSRVFQTGKDLSQYDFVISLGIGYCISFAVALRLKILGRKAKDVKHISYSFVQTRRLFITKFTFLNSIINGIFDRSDVFIVHSLIERKILSNAHGLDMRKFIFSHWGYDISTISPTRFSKRTRPYVCCIGRVNRDFKTFVKAIEGLDVDGVLITASYKLATLDVQETAQLKIYTDLDMASCLDCIQNSEVNIILVNHGNSGAGHITLVVSMLMGKVQIITGVETIKEYFIDGIHGYNVSIADEVGVRNAIIDILDDPENTKIKERAARSYADQWLTEKRAAKRLEYVMQCLMRGNDIEPVDQRWQSDYIKLTE